MNKTIIGILLICAGVAYGSTAIDAVYAKTLGWLVENQWIRPQIPKKEDKNSLGRKPTILLYSFALIIMGIFILWTRNN